MERLRQDCHVVEEEIGDTMISLVVAKLCGPLAAKRNDSRALAAASLGVAAEPCHHLGGHRGGQSSGRERVSRGPTPELDRGISGFASRNCHVKDWIACTTMPLRLPPSAVASRKGPSCRAQIVRWPQGERCGAAFSMSGRAEMRVLAGLQPFYA